jgi:uncharacterized protein YjbJ (UPF0337 family)
MNEDEIEGAARDALGKVKDATGGLTGDTGLQAEGKMDQASGKLQGKFGDVKDQFDNAVGTIAGKASELGGGARAAMHDAAKTVQRGAGQAGETVYDGGARAGKYVRRTVHDQPLLSLIGIAAIGYAIGFLIHSPTSPLVREPRRRRYFR